MNLKRVLFTLLLLNSANTVFSAAFITSNGSATGKRGFYQPNWFGAGFLKQERDGFNGLSLEQQKLLNVLLGRQVMQKQGGLKMVYPTNEQVYKAMIEYFDVVGDEAINTSIPLGIGLPLAYAKQHSNQTLIAELERRLAALELKKRQAPKEIEMIPVDAESRRRSAIKELEDDMANEAKSSLDAIPQL